MLLISGLAIVMLCRFCLYDQILTHDEQLNCPSVCYMRRAAWDLLSW